MSEAFDEFSKCLISEGVPESSAQSLLAFGGYVDQQRMAQPDDASAMELGRIYAACREPLDIELAAILKDERPEFIQRHLDQLKALSDLVEGSEAD